MANPNTFASRVYSAVNSLRDDNESDWEPDTNLPSIPVVEAISGVSGLSRKYLNAFGRHRQMPRNPVPKAEPKITEQQAVSELAEADQQLSAARARVAEAQRGAAIARKNYGEAVSLWMRQFQVTPLEQIRAYQQTSMATRAKMAAGQIPAPEVPTPVGHLGRVMAGQRGGSIDKRYGRQYARGAFPASMFGRKIAPQA
ncbi:MAG: hypothetical protein ABSC37_03125 [Xanthobacteraceae bacterium]|jgi:hypothetical protein